MTDELVKPTPKDLDLGLTMASKLALRSGWLDLTAHAADGQSPIIKLDAGAKLNPDWAAYGNAWWKPTDGLYGAGAGLRYRESLDLFVEGTGSTDGHYGITGGLSLRF